MKRMISLILLLVIGLFTQCTKEYNYGLHCAECIAYKKVPIHDTLTNEESFDLVNVHSKSWCDSQQIVIENFFNSYNDSFETLMNNSDSSTEYCIQCETTTELSDYRFYSSCY